VKKARSKRFLVFVTFLLAVTFAAMAALCSADDHKRKRDHSRKHDPTSWSEGFGRFSGKHHDEGNETTGQVAAWSFAAANLGVSLSLLIKGVNRFSPLSPQWKNALKKFTGTRKKYSMKPHYLLNPIILALALLHYSLSRCPSTSLPEWGLLGIALMMTLGIVMKLRLCPNSLLKSVYKVHTQPVAVLFVISLLVIGHMIAD